MLPVVRIPGGQAISYKRLVYPVVLSVRTCVVIRTNRDKNSSPAQLMFLRCALRQIRGIVVVSMFPDTMKNSEWRPWSWMHDPQARSGNHCSFSVDPIKGLTPKRGGSVHHISAKNLLQNRKSLNLNLGIQLQCFHHNTSNR
jgi:hypothetical protein